ncbi:superoxide dismutase[Cu-Zn] [Antrihabitans spumae]|jgi:superoxide dismutase, Cu-Zn family|uniref:Superoxide dismutase [Cu-Zn] n=1 Tax=Antrihabitans spumae TaxID=3373370 RepID=A0ABW7KGL0_9NOCA
MALSTPVRASWRIAAPLAAVAALGLAACSNGQVASDQPGTTPAPFTSSAAPSAEVQEGGMSATENNNPEGSSSSSSTSRIADLTDASGKKLGTVTFTADGEYVEIAVNATGLTPGFHGFHIHQGAECKPNSAAPDGEVGNFNSAGGHFQKDGATGHPATGDLTSLQVRNDGSVELVTTSDAFTLDDIDGKAVIVHSGPDNFANIPERYAPAPDEETLETGDAGTRVACGVIG